MTITPAVRISDRKVIVKDRTILTGVPDNVTSTSGSSSGPVEGVFIGAEFDEENTNHALHHGEYTVAGKEANARCNSSTLIAK